MNSRFFGLVAKLVILALANAMLVFAAYVAFLAGQTWIGVGLTTIVLVVNVVYFNKRFVAGKFLLPGVILLALFVVGPILYTIFMSGFNYKTGNEISKDEALVQLLDTGLVQDSSGKAFDMTPGVYKGKPAALLTDQTDRNVYLGFDGTLIPVDPSTTKLSKYGVALAIPGFAAWSSAQVANNESTILSFRFQQGSGKYVAAQSGDTAALVFQSFALSKDKKTLYDKVNNVHYKDNGNGNFVSTADGSFLYPGWKEFNPGQNYLGLITDPKISGPFARVFVWTVVFAFVTVLVMFFAGLVLALALEKKLKFRGLYRAILILPYAMPSFMSILIWNGMFNRQFGAINELIGSPVDWYNDPILAKVVLLVVNLWLGFPYFYMISTGALQALPSDIQEAAQIDGATGSQIFRLIKLPLLLQILSPLLIASFAFNFNNFNLVYLLTAGGPTDVLNGETAGATDILITYAYKTAFGSNEQNLGLASAISVVMFVIVGALSMWSLRQSKVLEDMK